MLVRALKAVQRAVPIRAGIALSLSGALLAFGIYNVHSVSRVTEGGAIGLSLFLYHVAGWSPAITSFTIDAACYALGWRTMGWGFLVRSAVASASFSVTYRILERFEPLWPNLAAHPLQAALMGAVFVGVGAGVSVRAGGAPGWDDALAMSVNRLTRLPVEWFYLISDVTVLLLSLVYIPFQRIAYSLITVVLSGQIVGWIQRLKGKTYREGGS